MFLTDLQERLRNEQTRSGNVKLDYVHVVHGTTLSIQHGFEPEQDEAPAETERPKPMSIAEAEGITGSLEDRLHTVGLSGIVSLTGAELAQLLEVRDEYASDLDVEANPPEPIPFRPRALDQVPAAMFIETARDQLRTVEVPRLQDQLKELHVAAGDQSVDFQAGYNLGLETARVCIETLPPRQLLEIREVGDAGDARKGVETMLPDLEGKGKEIRMPCPQFDENKVGCVLPFGHASDHNFDPRSLEPPASGNITGPAKSEE